MAKGLSLPTLYFDDLETYTKESWYFKLFNDTSAYLCGSIPLSLTYDKAFTKYTEGKLSQPYIFSGSKTLEQYFKFFLSEYYIKKNNLGIHQIHYFHNGRNFDFYFLIAYLNKIGINWIDTKPQFLNGFEQNKLYGTINWSQAYKTFKVYRKVSDRKLITLEFRDTLYLFNGTIEEFGKNLGILKGDTIESTKEAEIDGTISQTAIEYCLRDCEILAQWFLRFVKFLPKGTLIPATTSSWARQEFLNMYDTEQNKFDYFRDLIGIDKQEQEKINNYFVINNIYKGGLSTFNANYRLRDLKNIYVEDVVSQYPHKMTYDMPHGNMLSFESMPNNPDDYILFLEVYYKDIEIKYNTPSYLGYANKYTNFSRKADFYKHFETYEYIKIFEKLHTFKEKQITKIIGFKKAPSYFIDYVNKFFHLKENAKKGSPERDWAKLMLNGLYGKLVEKNSRVCQKFKGLVKEDETVLGLFSGNNLNMVNVIETYNTPFTYTHIGSYITSCARAYLLERTYEITKKGGVVLYHDTDSNFFMIDDKEKLNFNSKLGGWECEACDFYLNGYIIGSKKYILYDDINDDLKNSKRYKLGCAGISQKKLKEHSISHFIHNEPYHTLNKEFYLSGVVLVDDIKYLMDEDIFKMLERVYKHE